LSRHVLAQYLVDVRLPALAFPPVGGQHVRVNANRLIHLAVLLGRAALAAPQHVRDKLHTLKDLRKELSIGLPDSMCADLGIAPRVFRP
jgi:hypothetical protein